MEPSIATKAPQISNWATQGFTKAMRHEVGDFLQLVYFSIALMKKRLPAGADIENTVLANLQTRAEACKMLLDTAYQYLSPPEMTFELVDLHRLITDCVQKTRIRYQHLTISVDAFPIPHIRGDRTQLTQALHLLLLNAGECARKSVAVKLHRGTNENIVLTVTDDGEPVPVEKVQHIFEPFTPQRNGRTGLGLAPARRIMELHGGGIAVECLSEGFRVSVSLPEMPEASTTGQVPAAQPPGDPEHYAATYQSR